MFGMSLGKFLLLAVMILVVWYGFKYAARVEAVRQNLRAEARRRGNVGTAGARSTAGMGGMSAATAQPVEDLVKCRPCGSYVAAQGAGNCGKPACPWGP
jgi:hypothetical protein